MLREPVLMAWEALSSETLVQGLSQCYVAHSSDGWKSLDVCFENDDSKGPLRLVKTVRLEMHMRN